ncbi:hypothetical protein L1887_07182 [Cichorium endivia]|nr:hypothetical protein L1887_07182 [Cichorium endivia]
MRGDSTLGTKNFMGGCLELLREMELNSLELINSVEAQKTHPTRGSISWRAVREDHAPRINGYNGCSY